MGGEHKGEWWGGNGRTNAFFHDCKAPHRIAEKVLHTYAIQLSQSSKRTLHSIYTHQPIAYTNNSEADPQHTKRSTAVDFYATY